MKKINMEIKESLKASGYTMRANINPNCMKALKRWNKEDGFTIWATQKKRNQEIRKISANHDKIVYLNGESWGVFEADTRKCYQFEE